MNVYKLVFLRSKYTTKSNQKERKERDRESRESRAMTDLNAVLATANAHYSAGEFAQAAKVFGELISKAPDQFKGQLNLQQGASFFNSKNYEAAVNSFNNAIATGDEKVIPEARALKARAIERAGKLDEACDAYDEYFKTDPKGEFAKWAEFGN